MDSLELWKPIPTSTVLAHVNYIYCLDSMHRSRLNSVSDMAFSASLQETPRSYPGCGCSTTGPRSSCTRTRPPITFTPVTGTAPTLVSCDSVLVKVNPDDYPHCHCEFGPWSPFKFSSYQTSSTCPSGHKYVLESTRTRLSTKCTQKPATESQPREVCE